MDNAAELPDFFVAVVVTLVEAPGGHFDLFADGHVRGKILTYHDTLLIISQG